MNDVVIVSGARTPIGRLGGSLSTLPASRLGETVIREALRRAGVQPSEVSEVVLGQVLTAGCGQNPARQAAVAAGIPYTVPSYGINQVCASGLRAVVAGYQALQTGDARIVVAGGQESMSQAPHCAGMRAGLKLGDAALTDTLIKDGLTDAYLSCHMGNTAETVAQQWKITREEQDAFAVESQRKAHEAQQTGRFAEEIAAVRVPGRKGEVIVETDEEVRPDTTIEGLSRLRTVFQKEGGTVTAGNSSGISDGAAAMVLMQAEEAERRSIEPLARIVSWAVVGVEPGIMGIGPAPATLRALDKAGWKLDQIDLLEVNEAFAAQSCAVGRELHSKWDRVNVNGGAIALGHPIGASGARILVTLLHELRRRRARRGLATLCVGGGMGIALCVERD